ncbi:unnamed protein product, partial [Rotaria sp. Silwood1]
GSRLRKVAELWEEL